MHIQSQVDMEPAYRLHLAMNEVEIRSLIAALTDLRTGPDDVTGGEIVDRILAELDGMVNKPLRLRATGTNSYLAS